MMLLFLVTVGGHFAHDVLVAVDGVAVVEDLTIQVGGTDGQLACQSLEEGRLA